jgi:hypothetical protein
MDVGAVEAPTIQRSIMRARRSGWLARYAAARIRMYRIMVSVRLAGVNASEPAGSDPNGLEA